MTVASDDIVITGVGVVSPIGIGREAFWESLAAGRGGVRLVEAAGEVNGLHWMEAVYEGFEPKKFVQPRKILKVMCVESQAAFSAASMACAEAGIAPGSVDPDRLGTVFGSEMLFSENEDILQIVALCQTDGVMHHSRWGRNAMESMYPLWMLKSLPNMPACHVGIWLDARGPNNTLTTEETSGLAALIEAAHVIQRGQADCMLVGVAGDRTNLTRMVQRHESHFSQAYSDPVSACKPFDARRDGTVSGMGAAVVVIERRSHAEGRGAKALARLASWSSTFGKPIRPYEGSSDAIRRAIRQSIERAGLKADDIDHINASAGGFVAQDANEARGIREAVGDVPVTAIKGFVGDSCAGSGLVELSASLCGLPTRSVPFTLNHQQTAGDCPVNVIRDAVKPLTKPNFVKCSLNSSGLAAAVVIASE
jgi:3-oxoacyl-[acyl-carrier-protein] synthase II